MKPSALLLALIAAGVATPGSARASEDFCSRLVIYAVQQVCQLLGNGLTQCQPVGVAGPAPGCAQPGTPAYWPVAMGPPVIQMPPALPHASLLPNPYLTWNVRPYGGVPGMAMPAVPPASMVVPSIPAPARDAAPVGAIPPQRAERDAASTAVVGETGAGMGVTAAGERAAAPRTVAPMRVPTATRDAVLDNLADSGQSVQEAVRETVAGELLPPISDAVDARPSPVVASTTPVDAPATPAGDAPAEPGGHPHAAVTAGPDASLLPVTEPMSPHTPLAPAGAATVQPDTPPSADRPDPAPAPATPAVVAREQVVIDEAKAHFAFDSADLTDAGRAAIDDWLRQVPAGMRVRLTGHADRLGPAPYNLDLSRRRAESVRDYLVRRGYAAGDIRVLAKGESEPVKQCAGGATPATKACLAPNRRVEIAAD